MRQVEIYVGWSKNLQKYSGQVKLISIALMGKYCPPSPPWNMGTSGGHKATMAKVRKGQLNLRGFFPKGLTHTCFSKLLSKCSYEYLVAEIVKNKLYQYFQCNNVGKDTLGVKILCIMIHPRRICVTNSQVRLRGRGERTPTVNPVVVNIQTSSLGPFIQRTRKFPSIAPRSLFDRDNNHIPNYEE